jgi:hypothetical protein
MSAWNRLFQRDLSNSGLLITGSDSAFDYLLADVEEKHEVLNFTITTTQKESDEETAGYPSLVEDLQRIFNMVLTTPWDQALEEKVMDAGREVATRIADTGKSHPGTYGRGISFSWHVVPHRSASTLFNRSCRTKTDQEEDVTTEIKNTVVGLARKS